MPLYGLRQPGYNTDSTLNLSSVGQGESYTLFDGTETPAAGVASVAFSRAPGGSDSNAGITFSIDWSVAPTAAVVIQASNTNIEADYVTVYTSTNLQHDLYTDQGRSAFYRAKISSYSVGTSLIVKAQR